MPKNTFHLEVKANRAGNRGELMVYSSISPYSWDRENPNTTSRNFDKALKELGDVDEIIVRINSPGGAVNEAVAIRTALMKHKASKIIDIEGTCASAATIIACLPGARVRMAKGGDYMIHRSSWIAWGHADAMLSAYNSLMNTDNDLADIYAERTGKTKDECLEMMDKETWLNAEDAVKEGFVDEIISGEEGEEPIAACAVSAEMYELMKSCYAHTPELPVIQQEATGNQPVSNVKTAVAAGNTSENMGETPKQGGKVHMEINGATAEMIQQENPEAAQAIANAATEAALRAERERVAKIRKLTDKGAKWEAMRDQAIEEGTSVEAYLEAVIAEKDKERQENGQAFIAGRQAETAPAAKIGAGDAGEMDGKNSKEAEDKLAKELADLAAGMDISTNEMA